MYGASIPDIFCKTEDVILLTEFSFYVTSILFGISLAMDAFSVSLANGMNEPRMKLGKSCGIAAMFAFFQALMPFIGWIMMTTILSLFKSLTAIIPWVAFLLLGFIGGKMLYEGISCNAGNECNCNKPLGIGALVVQGIATSIDALSAGTGFEGYELIDAVVASVIIAIVTFIICVCGVEIGKKTGMLLAGKSSILGGVILVLIGIYILAKAYIPALQ